jgi:hypothetical protein
MTAQEQKTASNKQRREYRKTHPNGRVPGYFNENDRSIIKAYCKAEGPLFRAIVDLENNNCTINIIIDDISFFIGNVQKVVYNDTFVLLNEFKLYINRNIQKGDKPLSVILPIGTEIIISQDDKNKVLVLVGDNYILVDRWIFSTKANMRQLYSLFLTNPEERVGLEDNQTKIDLVRIVNSYNQLKYHSACTK